MVSTIGPKAKMISSCRDEGRTGQEYLRLYKTDMLDMIYLWLKPQAIILHPSGMKKNQEINYDGFIMKIYLSTNSIPEFTNINSVERKKAWRSCCYKSIRHWQIWAIEIFLIVAIIPAIQLYDYLERTYGMNLWVFVSVFTIYAAVTTCISINIHIEFTRPYLKKYLDENNKNNNEKAS